MQKKFNTANGFTLVELIVVITILGILSTIGFVAYQGYSQDARDSDRLSTGRNMEKVLNLYQSQSGNFPLPDEKVKITLDATSMSYQGYLGEKVAQAISLGFNPKDPKDDSQYIYATSGDRKLYQILLFLEGNDYTFQNHGIIPQANAQVAGENQKSFGDKIGIIFNENDEMIDLINTPSGTLEIVGIASDYSGYFGKYKLTGNGVALKSGYASANRISDPSDPTLIGYWDFETKEGVNLKDMSKLSNHGVPFSDGDNSPIGNFSVGNTDGIIGKATHFSDENYFKIPSNTGELNTIGPASFSFWFKADILGTQMNLYAKKTSANSNGESYRIAIGSDTMFYSTWGNDDRYSREYPVTTGEWYLGTVTFDPAGYVSVYRNGILTDRGSWPAGNFTTNNVGDFYIGTKQNNWGFFNGTLDDFRIYDRVLSASEVQFIYNIK